MAVQDAFWSSWFGVSVVGIGVILLVTAVTVFHLLFRGRRHPLHRWLVVATAAVAIASLITPADVASTLIVAASFLLFFAIGANSRPLGPPTAS